MTLSLGFKTQDGVARSRTAHAKLNQLRTAGLGKPRQKPKHFFRSRRVGLSLTDGEAAGHVFGRGLSPDPLNVNTGGQHGH